MRVDLVMEILLTIYLAALTALTCIFGALALRAWRRAAAAERRAVAAEVAVEDMIGVDVAKRQTRIRGEEELSKIRTLLRSEQARVDGC